MRKRIRLGLGLGLGGEMSGSRLELLQMKQGKVRVMGRVRVARRHIGMSRTFA